MGMLSLCSVFCDHATILKIQAVVERAVSWGRQYKQHKQCVYQAWQDHYLGGISVKLVEMKTRLEWNEIQWQIEINQMKMACLQLIMKFMQMCSAFSVPVTPST